jgi:NDP-sugar pyrophosphorylase family protein
MKRAVIEQLVPAPRTPEDKADLADLFHALSRHGDLAGLEMTERFFEIGSPAGLQDFERWMSARS